MQFVKRARTFAVLAVLAVAACTEGGLANSVSYSPPPPLALVALVDPASDQLAAQLQQLEGVIRSSAEPGEALVVMLLTPGSRSYTVRPGDSLSSIASSSGLTLQEVEGANPQLGPVSGRNWSVIHTGERVTLPDRAAPSPLLVVTRAPAGPPPPSLVRLPREPQNPTDYQRAQYQRALTSANSTNSARIQAWRASAAAAMAPWQDQVAALLEKKAAAVSPPTNSATAAGMSAGVVAGVTTLTGLAGRRLLLVLGGSAVAPPAFVPRSMVGMTLVVANVADPGAAAAWTAAGTGAGANPISTLDPALTQLQLAQTVNR